MRFRLLGKQADVWKEFGRRGGYWRNWSGLPSSCDSRESLNTMGLEVRIAIVRPFLVRSAVNEEKRIIFIQRSSYCEYGIQ
jgi:hypothetical protein